MSVEENKALVRRWTEEAFTNPDACAEFLSEGYTIHGGSGGRWPPQLQSRDSMAQYLQQTTAEVPSFRIAIDDIIAEGDTVAVRATRYLEGKPIANAMAFYRVADGRIVENWTCATEIEE
jgi:predicted SnoaL-like aldol condensation-catalyzing enzyme